MKTLLIMKTNLLALIVLTLLFGHLSATPVDLATAKKAGAGYAQTTFSSMSRTNEMLLVKATDDYYVFNVGATGFVIVSADDRFRPIVGYSEEGSFPVENPSPEMKYYLDNLSQGRQAALRANFTADPQVKEEWSRLLSGQTLPSRNGGAASFYLMTTKWNQNAPYNKYAPGNSYAGCVATAMSQVMNYWKYPSHGWGQHSYYHYAWGELSVDFSEAEYDFENMPNSINNMSQPEAIDAIAKFMYHCGVAVDMDYSTDGSGAYSQDVPDAVLKYFGYSNRCRIYSRDAYELADFHALLKDQLDLGWPCYYSGTDTNGQGGHAFVCDGYDDNDMFHFNWGWSGSGDGFFVIDGLNVSGYAFNSGQAVVANFVPVGVVENTASAPDLFTAVPDGGNSFSATLSWVNPTHTIDGHTIDAIEKLFIMKDGDVIDSIENPVPGQSMTQQVMVGLPVMVDFSVCAVVNGYKGRMSHARGVNLGPVCHWKVRCFSTEGRDMDGELSLFNSSGVKIGEFAVESADKSYEVEVPLGAVSMWWTAPTDSCGVELSIVDADDQPVFTYSGPSTAMPVNLFYEMVNTCGAERGLLHPKNLTARVESEDVILTWEGIPDPGYGYNIYRDRLLHAMVADTCAFVDRNASSQSHTYYVTAFGPEGDSDPSNVTGAVAETEVKAPRNLDAEVLEDNKVKLTWEAPETLEDFAGYKVYRAEQGGEYKIIRILSQNYTTYTDNPYQLEGKRLRYQITGLYNNGKVESSPAATATHPDLYELEINKTHLPAGLTLSTDGETDRLLQWDPAFLAESYNVYRNGELLAEGLTDLQYVDAEEPATNILVYQVTGVKNGVESSPSNRACWGNVSVQETKEDLVTVYPNPTSGSVLLHAEGLLEVSVYNVTGQRLLLQKATAAEMSLDLSDWQSGMYYLHVRTRQGSSVQKVVLMKK